MSAASSLRHVIQCGEKLDWATVDAFRATMPATASLSNVYGATESATTCWTAPAPSYWPDFTPRDSAMVPAGHPHANTTVYVLGEAGQPVPLGAVGTIHFAGCLASGYQAMPDLSAQKFKPGGPEGLTLYNTGDLGRVDKNGELTCLGRSDRQVKVRGFRVELWDVEEALKKAVGDDNAAGVEVVATIADSDPADLVGFVASTGATMLSGPALRDQMFAMVPTYLVPKLVLVLEEGLPRLANGKVDMQAVKAQATAAVEQVRVCVL